MPSTEPSKPKMHTPDLVSENIAWVAERFPGCITESHDDNGELVRAVDFDLLRQELSGELVEGPQERYHLNWPGKREALLAANAPIARTLRPCREESVDFDTTRNLFIEGDNLEALKLLQETYLNSVDIIYIDPPYNTGSDRVYKDTFGVAQLDHEEMSSERSEGGDRLVANPESNGRYHSNWATMMLPRLRLARSLLADDGVLFISIADHEVHNLRHLCDEVFGRESFVASLIWRKKYTLSFTANDVIAVHEYIVAYSRKLSPGLADARWREATTVAVNPVFKSQNASSVKTLRAGARLSDDDMDLILRAGDYPLKSQTLSYLDDARFEAGVLQDDVRIKARFAVGQQTLDAERHRIRVSHSGAAYIDSEPKENVIAPLSILFDYTKDDKEALYQNYLARKAVSTRQATDELETLLGAKVFDNPKPTSLIQYLLASVPKKDALVLDFFAGSGTTGQAVWGTNADDGGTRRFILVQLPEECEENGAALASGYQTIAQIAKERIRRAGSSFKHADGLSTGELDTGFRVLKIDSSNMKDVYYRPGDAAPALLGGQVDNIKDDRTDEDLLFQVLLDWGLPLSYPIANETIAGKPVYFVDGNALAACFAPGVDDAFVKELAGRQPGGLPIRKAVFRDAGYANDATKINVRELFKQLSPTTEVRTL